MRTTRPSRMMSSGDGASVSQAASTSRDDWVCMLNPAAGAVRDRAVRRRIEEAMRALGIPVLDLSQHATDASAIVASTAIETVIACGGDGTVNEVLNMMDCERQRLAVLPGGRGNSLARDLGVGKLDVALESLCEGVDVRLDAMQIRVRVSGSNQVSSLAVHAVGFGVLPAVVASARRRSATGALGYVISALLNYTAALKYDVALDGVSLGVERCSGVVVQNTRHLSMHTPYRSARPDDGRLDILLQPSSFLAEKLAEAAMIAGLPAIGLRHHESGTVKIRPAVPVPLYVDGELIDRVAELDVSVIPAAITAIAGPRNSRLLSVRSERPDPI